MSVALQQQEFEAQQQVHRSTILRVYNYYRIGLSFALLWFFVDPDLNAFVGQVNPELFQRTILIYLAANILIGLATFVISVELLSRTAPSFVILTLDIIALTLLMSASGGVSSGLGNFMIFTLAFGGGLILGRVSTVLPAIAFILTIYDEFYLFFLDQNDFQSFFQAGLLGVVYFVANILFQTLSRQLRSRETEVHTLEQINQHVVDSMRTGVVVIGEANSPRLINQAAELLLETPGEAPPHEKLPDSLLSRVNAWRDHAAAGEEEFSPYPSGPESLLSFTRLNNFDPASDVLVFLEDSTELQRQAQQLKLASVGRLSASISHEIRNPLGAISHAAQLLGESETLDKGDARLCEIIQNHCVRMNEVVENVLQLSRRQTASPRELNLRQWLSDFVSEFTAGLPDKPDITLDVRDDAIMFAADPSHMSQVLGNLCQNGLRYSAKQTGENKLLVVADKDAQHRPYVEVIDYGTGVAEENMGNLFEPFFTTETTGTGLGLYLSRELCQANDARLGYARAATGGGCFRITFMMEAVS